jgi:aquaporin NIP
MFFGTYAIVYSQESSNFGDFGIYLVFGGAVLMGILLFAKISGAHMNPAVTLMSMLILKLRVPTGVLLILLQIFASLSASLLVQYLANPSLNIGTTLPTISIFAAWLMEFGLTLILMVSILLTHKKHLFVLALTVGTVVFLIAYFFGQYTGASMNPIRSLGPAIVSGQLEHLWIYLTAPMSAAITLSLILKNRYQKP